MEIIKIYVDAITDKNGCFIVGQTIAVVFRDGFSFKHRLVLGYVEAIGIENFKIMEPMKFSVSFET